jgi:hypothetical protein
VTFLAASEQYDWPDPPDVVPYSKDGIELIAPVHRKGTIRGKVLLPDGKPAVGVKIRAEGRGRTVHFCCQTAVTAADGSYAMALSPDQLYMVAVVDDDWTAPTQAGLTLRVGEAKKDVDFTLERGALVCGRVIGRDGMWLAGNLVFLRYKGLPLPKEYRGPTPDLAGDAALIRQTVSGIGGTYAFRVPPGQYEIGAAAGAGGADAMHYHLKPIQVTDRDVIMDLACNRAGKSADLTASIVKANHGEPYDFATLRVRESAGNGCASCHRPHQSSAR